MRRWSRGSRLFLALAVIAGGGAFVVVRGYAERVEALAPALGEPVPVVVAGEELVRGTVLEPGMLRVVAIPSRFAPPGAFGSSDEVAGRTLLTDVAAGEAVTGTRVGPAGGGPIASLVPEGLRAVVMDAGLPAGTVRPGDRVDVLATFGGGRPYTTTVARGVEVLLVLGGAGSGAGGSAQGAASGGGPAVGSGSPGHLVLLVSADQAERLAHAMAFARLVVSVVGTPASTEPGDPSEPAGAA
ncbi:MAG: Flp pilus assembly protein CpaB [Actinobacteria bacterium]|nr:Flp pilus assembly protein CpaB [Actinomycetota bacterium]